MARIVPKSPFLRHVEHEDWKRDPLVEKWLSPDGIAKGVNLVDMVGGTIHSAVEAATEDPTGRVPIKDAYGMAAKADNPKARQRAAIAIQNATGRARTMRWTDRMAGKAQSQLVQDTARLFPPMKVSKGGSGSAQSTKIVSDRWRTDFDKWSESDAVKGIEYAYSFMTDPNELFEQDASGEWSLRATPNDLAVEARLIESDPEGQEKVEALRLSRRNTARKAINLARGNAEGGEGAIDIRRAHAGIRARREDYSKLVGMTSTSMRDDPEYRARMKHLLSTGMGGATFDPRNQAQAAYQYKRFADRGGLPNLVGAGRKPNQGIKQPLKAAPKALSREENVESVYSVSDYFGPGVTPAGLVSILAAESNLDPTAKNPKPGQSAQGIIQLTNGAARDIGYKDANDAMGGKTMAEQMEVFKEYIDMIGKRHGIEPGEWDNESIYRAIFLPSSLGKDKSTIVARKGDKIYKANTPKGKKFSPMDVDQNGTITAGEIDRFGRKRMGSVRLPSRPAPAPVPALVALGQGSGTPAQNESGSAIERAMALVMPSSDPLPKKVVDVKGVPENPPVIATQERRLVRRGGPPDLSGSPNFNMRPATRKPAFAKPKSTPKNNMRSEAAKGQVFSRLDQKTKRKWVSQKPSGYNLSKWIELYSEFNGDAAKARESIK